MFRGIFVVLLLVSLFVVAMISVGAARADEAKIKSALSGAPSSIAKNAGVEDWDGTVLREGTNGWTCLPDIPNNGGTDPYCVDETFLSFIRAMQNNVAPKMDKLAISYMLAGDAPASNIDPTATEKTDDNVWVEGIRAHMMLAVPDIKLIDNISDDPYNGGPWLMWAGTPYVHVMVPIDSYPPE